jgi:proprotein convertase subtilisin/kexin type 5
MSPVDTPIKKCVTCDPSCDGCNGETASDCTGCPSGKVLKNGVCKIGCGEKEFYDEFDTQVCRPCLDFCDTCDKNNNHMMKCDVNVFYNFEILTEEPDVELQSEEEGQTS